LVVGEMHAGEVGIRVSRHLGSAGMALLHDPGSVRDRSGTCPDPFRAGNPILKELEAPERCRRRWVVVEGAEVGLAVAGSGGEGPEGAGQGPGAAGVWPGGAGAGRNTVGTGVRAQSEGARVRVRGVRVLDGVLEAAKVVLDVLECWRLGRSAGWRAGVLEFGPGCWSLGRSAGV